MECVSLTDVLRPEDGSKSPEDLLLLRYRRLGFISRDEASACLRLRRDFLVYMRGSEHYERQNDYLVTKLTFWKRYQAALSAVPACCQKDLLATVLDNLPVGRPERFPTSPPPEMIGFKHACGFLIAHYQQAIA